MLECVLIKRVGEILLSIGSLYDHSLLVDHVRNSSIRSPVPVGYAKVRGRSFVNVDNVGGVQGCYLLGVFNKKLL